LQAPRRADTEERPHPETEIESADMHKHGFELLGGFGQSPSSAPCTVTPTTRVDHSA
jgi:hypothetical protein